MKDNEGFKDHTKQYKERLERMRWFQEDLWRRVNEPTVVSPPLTASIESLPFRLPQDVPLYIVVYLHTIQC